MFPMQSKSCLIQRLLSPLLTSAVLLCAIAPASAQDAKQEAPPDAKPAMKRAMKRAGPADIAPITMGQIQYRVIHFGRAEGLDQNGGYIAAHDKKSGEKLWTLKVYTTPVDPQLERDVQDVFITRMRKQGKHLAIDDEQGHHYLVDVAKRSVSVKSR